MDYKEMQKHKAKNSTKETKDFIKHMVGEKSIQEFFEEKIIKNKSIEPIDKNVIDPYMLLVLLEKEVSYIHIKVVRTEKQNYIKFRASPFKHANKTESLLACGAFVVFLAILAYLF